MRMTIAALCLIFVWGGVGLAQGIHYIPSDTPGTGTCFNDFFPGSGESRALFLIQNNDVHPKMGEALLITDIAFAPCVTGLFTATNLQIRMTNAFLSTLGTCFDTNHRAPMLVYDGPIKWQATKDKWSPIGLQFPFITNRGWDHVIIEIRFTGGNMEVPLHTTPTMVRIHNPKSYTAPCATSGTESRGPKVRLTYDMAKPLTLITVDHMHMGPRGGRVQIVNGTPGDNYILAASFGQAPLDLGKCKINLAWDPLFVTSVLVGPPMFNNYKGTIDGFGEGWGYIFGPNNPILFGLDIYHVAVTYDKNGITGCTNTAGMEIWF